MEVSMKKVLVFATIFAVLLLVGCGGSGNKQNDSDEIENQDLDTPDEDIPDQEQDDEQKPANDDINVPDNDSDSTEPDYGSSKCPEIFICYISCKSEECLQSCIKKGAKDETEKFSAMYDCWLEKCDNKVFDDDFTSCVEENCHAKTTECGIELKGDDSVQRFPKPYGEVKISLANRNIVEAGDSHMDNHRPFAIGYIGSTTVEPDYYSTIYYYYTEFVESEDGNFFRTAQFHVNNQNQPIGHAFLLLPENIEKGKVKIGLDDASDGKFFIALIQEGEVVCYDGFGIGELEIKAVERPASEESGKLAASGEITVYSPLNMPEDAAGSSAALDKPLCAPKYPKFAGKQMYESTFISEEWLLDETLTFTDAEKYFAFEGSGLVSLDTEYPDQLAVDYEELAGIYYGFVSPSASFSKETVENNKPAVHLSVGTTSLSVEVTLPLSDIQNSAMLGKPQPKAPQTKVYKVTWSNEEEEVYGYSVPKYGKACIVAENKVENGVRAGSFQSTYYDKIDFDSDNAPSDLTVVILAELVEGEELLELYPEASTLDDLCVCSDTINSEDVECDSISWNDL